MQHISVTARQHHLKFRIWVFRRRKLAVPRRPLLTTSIRNFPEFRVCFAYSDVRGSDLRWLCTVLHIPFSSSDGRNDTHIAAKQHHRTERRQAVTVVCLPGPSSFDQLCSSLDSDSLLGQVNRFEAFKTFGRLHWWTTARDSWLPAWPCQNCAAPETISGLTILQPTS